MKKFNYIAPETIEEVSALISDSRSMLSAGATDIIGELKENILPHYPENLVSLKNVKGLDNISVESDGLHIGAMATLKNISSSSEVRKGWSALADAAYSVASPNIRTSATIGGNICQDIRCWYYRYPNTVGGMINCARKEGVLCSAMMGENRYHSIFGAEKVYETPCQGKCPAHTDIPAYMELYRNGDIEAAARVIMEVNPMPAITSRVCAHFCMEGCNRNRFDESVNIGAVERNIGDYVLEHYGTFMQKPEHENGKRISIIGSGPSGLTAAYYLRESGYAVTVYEKRAEAGGCLMYAIPAYRLPKDIVRKFISILSEMGIEFVCGTTVGEDISMEEICGKSDSVLVDTGTWKRPLIGLKGEELTRFGLDFLVDINEYISESLGDKVVVVGGGNVAMDVAITAKRLGVKDVRMVCLEDRETMPANREEIERALDEGVEIFNSYGPKTIIRKDGKVSAIEFKRCTSLKDAMGRFSPTYDENDTVTFDSDVIIMAIGQRSDLSFLEGAYSVEVNRGRIVTDIDNATSVAGIFASGDVTTGPATVIKAIAGGKHSALAINRYLDGGALKVTQVSLARPRNLRLTFASSCSSCPGQSKQSMIAPEERALNKEDMKPLDDAAVKEEIKRCCNCGCLAVNPSDMANMLLAYDARFRTNMRTMSAVELLTRNTKIQEVLKPGEIILEVIVPSVSENNRSRYVKYRTRKSIDFAILAVASSFDLDGDTFRRARLVLGAVAPVPMRMFEVEKFLIGRKVSEAVAHEAAELALRDAVPLRYNAYKIDMAKQLIVDTIMALKA